MKVAQLEKPERFKLLLLIACRALRIHRSDLLAQFSFNAGNS